MPFAGFLTASGNLLFWPVVVIGFLGNISGSSLAFYIGRRGGRPIIEKYGKYVLLSHHDLAVSDRFFARHEIAATILGRIMPVVKVLISLSAGIANINFKKFFLYSLPGVFIYLGALVYVGRILGENWNAVTPYFHKFDTVMIVLIAIGIILYVWRHLRNQRKTNN